ncbi:hypothetical protein F4819DRAFT_376640 [Hypoxylon fuscum]|nr:hypothetical protein F4819DRAFT_376640 [Hypoxylon fuscum]
MEAVAVVGLASNVLQFVEITAKLIRISNELRNDAASSENQDHRVIATHFEALAQGIKTSARAISQTSATASSEDKALQPVADRCCELANDLLGRLQKCGIQPGQNGSRFQRTKVAFKSLWNKKEIVEISNRLQLFRSELNLHYTTQIRKTQLDQQTRHSTTDDAQETLRRIDNLGTLIGDLQLDINGTVNSRCSEILDCITVSQSENSQLHAQATQQALVGHAALLNRLDNLQLSMETANISLGNVQTRQSETLDSIARVRVENSAFLVSATQQVSSDDSSGASFRNVIKPLFEEFMDRALTEMKKEYRNTARSETDNLMNNVLPVLHEMQYRSRATRQDSPDVTDETESQIDRGDIGLRSSSFESQRIKVLHGQASRRQDKKSVTIVYRNSWDWKTKLGNFFLAIHDRVYFDAYGRATSIYELTAQFVPSSSWFSTGCSIKYETISDARGDPKFCFRPPKTFRVLEEDHYVWDAIRRNDVSSIQSMLSQKLISPSDQNSVGFTLLHEAMLYNGLDITKALVQSGADINACDQ